MPLLNRINHRNPVLRESRQSALQNSRLATSRQQIKSLGPYKIINICGPKGIGVEPIFEYQKTGFWFIGLPPESQEVYWFRTGHTQEELNQLCGLTEDSFIGRLFYVEPNGLAYILDQSGNGVFPGETTDRPKNILQSTVPLSISGLSGISFPGIEDIMSSLRKARNDK